MTRRVEFQILTSRVIRLQGKRLFQSMQHFGTIKVDGVRYIEPHQVEFQFESISGRYFVILEKVLRINLSIDCFTGRIADKGLHNLFENFQKSDKSANLRRKHRFFMKTTYLFLVPGVPFSSLFGPGPHLTTKALKSKNNL